MHPNRRIAEAVIPGTLADARFALRTLWRHRTFAIAVVLTLATGFGATSAVFAVYRAALLRPLTVPEPDRLVFVHRYETRRAYYSSTSYPAFLEYRARAADVVAFAAYTTGSAPLDLGGVRRVAAVMVSDGYFGIAGVAPLRGRLLRAGDQRDEAVISERLWTDTFDRDESVVGRSLMISGRATTVVGVLPASFTGFNREMRGDLWLPLETVASFAESVNEWGRDWLEVVGRLRPGVSRERAESALRAIGVSLAARGADTEADWRLVLSGGARGNVYPDDREQTVKLLRLLGAVALLLLLVTCGTAANLSIARLQSRGRELRTRLAIGADRGHLLRLLAIEHALLAGAAAATGSLFAVWIPAFFASYALPGAVRLSDLPVRFDAAQAGFAGGLLLLLAAVLTAFTTPTWWSRRGVLLPEGNRASRRLVIRRTLVTAQVAMSLALLCCGGLLFKALRSQIDLDAAFRAQRVLMARLDLPHAGSATPVIGGDVFRSVRERVAGTDGVTSASWSFIVPYGGRRMRTSLAPRNASQAEPPPGFDANVVDVGYFRTVNVPILRGRAFTEADREGAERVVIVTEALAARYWPGRDPLGQRVAGRTGAVWTIVGVVPDDLHYDIRTLRGGQREHVFFPLAQNYRDVLPMLDSLTLLVSTSGDPLALAGPVRTILRAEMPQAEPAMTTARRHVDAALSQEWLAASTAGAMAGLALALAAIGLYGIVRYTVAQRTREIAIRLALGAAPRAVVALAFGDAALTLVPGTALGLAIAWPFARAIRPLLHDVRPFDGAVLALAVTLTAACALLAVWLPARAAARIEPADALRLE